MKTGECSNMTIALTILGASGKMGQKVLELARKDPDFHIAALYSRKESDLPYALAQCNVAIDFSSPEGAAQHLEAAVSAKKALVIGTTGLSDQEKQAIDDAARTIPILYSPNFSFGMALCLDAAARLGKVLFGKSAIDIQETHHVHKKDRPSGTALALAKAIGNGKVIFQNEGSSRKKEEILIHSTRSGETVGEHSLIFESDHERIEIKHTAHSRDAFAHGALMGAKFLAKQAPGLYMLQDMFIGI
jgi:4-hydroxy-tetrahydrodipicolinate reductase